MKKSVSTFMILTVIVILTFLYSSGFTQPEDVDSDRSMVSIPAIADSLGFSWQWERTFRRLTCVRPPQKFRFYEGIRFYYDNGTIRQLPVAPFRSGATLYLPAHILISLIKRNEILSASEDDSTKKTSLKSGKNILSVISEKKTNGTLLTISLADSLPLNVTYYFPNLTFNFYGGKVDTSLVRQVERIGIIDSIFSIQFQSSAQITALLTREIDEPMIDYVQDTRTVLVSLWPKKIRPVKKKKTVPAPVIKKNDTKTIIVIDPGHGGKDPGAISEKGVKEKDVVLAIGLNLRDRLKKEPNLVIHMTRDRDVFIPLRNRTKFANEKKAHLFISVHSDAISGSVKKKQSIRGYKSYFLSQAKNEEDKLVAMRENAVIELEEKPQHYSNLQNVLIEMAGNEYLRESQDLCIQIDKEFTAALNKKIAKLHRGVGQANFWVLNGAFMPSVLIETGFLSHRKEEKLLSDRKFQQEMADAIGSAVIAFCKRYETGL